VLRRQRPPTRGPRDRRFRRPRTFSFPSAHTSSAFAFTVAAGAEMPALRGPLGLLAAAVAYSRIHNRVHYPSDVLAGAAIGAAIGLGSRRLVAWIGPGGKAAGTKSGVPTREIVLVTSPHAGRAAKLNRARAALQAEGLQIRSELTIEQLPRLAEATKTAPDEVEPLVVAAGGDGTVGAVANEMAETGLVLGILPLGTSNDFARSLEIPMRIERAARVLRTGQVSTVDLGRLVAPGEAPRHFVHAATAGLNVSFAKLATNAS